MTGKEDTYIVAQSPISIDPILSLSTYTIYNINST